MCRRGGASASRWGSHGTAHSASVAFVQPPRGTVSPVRELNDRDLARILRNYELGLGVLVPGGLPAALHEQFSDLSYQRKLGLARGG
jgi:hypothetical protein